MLKSPLFDVAWYAAGQRKLKGDRLDVALHYLKKGAAKGHNPSSKFDAAWYQSAVSRTLRRRASIRCFTISNMG